MKYLLLTCLAAFVSAAVPKNSSAEIGDPHPTLAIGSKAPDFHLTGVDGRQYSLASFKDAKVLVIAFTCNHCPTAQAYEDRLIRFARDYGPRGVALVAISPNDPKSIRLDELGYTDLSDSFEEMKIRAREKKYSFPYLYDGGTQQTAHAYGPVATPHLFIFDASRKLCYQGRFDNLEKPTGTPTSHDAENATEALLKGLEVPVATTKVFGCSVKWADKSVGVKRAMEEWANEPVEVKTINENGIRDLLRNNSDKLRLINLWATWCGPCVTEFADLVNINRMYRGRDFEFITISADDTAKSAKVLQFLKDKQSSAINFLFNGESKYTLIEAVDPQWGGALPYTVLVEPGGRIVYRVDGAIDPRQLKKAIVNDSLIGHYY